MALPPLLSSALSFLVALPVAIWLAPEAPRTERATALAPPPSVGVAKVLALGRHDAAADLAWMRATQFIGAPHSERVRYAGLEDWVKLANALSPFYERPYFGGSIILSTLPGRQATAAEILAGAEQTLAPAACRESTACPLPDFTSPDDVEDKCVPCASLVEAGCNWRVPLSQGFVAYFGQLDPATASRFFCESRRRGGPGYLTPFSARLARTGHTCKQLRAELLGVSSQVDDGGSDLLRGRSEQLRVLVNCEQEELKHASQAYQLRTGEWPDTIPQLLEQGLLEAPPWVPGPGLCWTRRTDDIGFALAPCEKP